MRMDDERLQMDGRTSAVIDAVSRVILAGFAVWDKVTAPIWCRSAQRKWGRSS